MLLEHLQKRNKLKLINKQGKPCLNFTTNWPFITEPENNVEENLGPRKNNKL